MSRCDVILSVVVPAFNASRWLAQCVESVLDQDCLEFVEVVVVDDGSQDGTAATAADLMRAYPSNLRLLRQQNAGPSAARNRGRDVARGEFVMYLDADDYLLPGALPGLVSMLDSSNADLVATGWTETCDKTGRELHRATNILPIPESPLASIIKQLRPVSALIARRGGAEWDRDRRVWEVMRWMNRSAFAGASVDVYPPAVSTYRQNHSLVRLSIVEPHSDPVVEGDFWIEEMHALRLAGELSPVCREVIDEKLMSCAYVAVRHGRIRDATRLLDAVDRRTVSSYRWVRTFGATGFGAHFGVAGLRVFAAVNRLLGRA